MRVKHDISHRAITAQSGFTLIELIIIIVLLGVLAVTAATRFQGKSGYAEYAFQSRLVSALRHVQTQAMQDTRPALCYQMVFNYNTGAQAFGPPSKNFSAANAAETCQNSISESTPEPLRTQPGELTGDGVILSSKSGNVQNFPWMRFDNLGRPVTPAGRCDNGDGCRITFTSEVSASVCINREGYIHECE